MISLFGIISFAVAVVAIYALYQHSQLMKRRTAVDDGLRKIDSALDEGEDFEPLILAYNTAVDEYNEYIGNFPGKIVSAMVGFREEQHYEFD